MQTLLAHLLPEESTATISSQRRFRSEALTHDHVSILRPDHSPARSRPTTRQGDRLRVGRISPRAKSGCFETPRSSSSTAPPGPVSRQRARPRTILLDHCVRAGVRSPHRWPEPARRASARVRELVRSSCSPGTATGPMRSAPSLGSSLGGRDQHCRRALAGQRFAESKSRHRTHTPSPCREHIPHWRHALVAQISRLGNGRRSRFDRGTSPATRIWPGDDAGRLGTCHIVTARRQPEDALSYRIHWLHPSSADSTPG